MILNAEADLLEASNITRQEKNNCITYTETFKDGRIVTATLYLQAKKDECYCNLHTPQVDENGDGVVSTRLLSNTFHDVRDRYFEIFFNK